MNALADFIRDLAQAIGLAIVLAAILFVVVVAWVVSLCLLYEVERAERRKVTDGRVRRVSPEARGTVRQDR